jgi:hypothetical protein
MYATSNTIAREVHCEVRRKAENAGGSMLAMGAGCMQRWGRPVVDCCGLLVVQPARFARTALSCHGPTAFQLQTQWGGRLDGKTRHISFTLC